MHTRSFTPSPLHPFTPSLPHALTLTLLDATHSPCIARTSLQGFPILKTLYAKELPNVIRVRALCGLCKMASVGSGAKNLRSMSEHSMINLAKKLRPYVLLGGGEAERRRKREEGMKVVLVGGEKEGRGVGLVDGGVE